MECDDEAEPSPLKPARSDRLCISIGHQPREASSFGPNERSLSRHVRAAEKDTSPPPPSERSLSRICSPRAVVEDLENDIARPSQRQQERATAESVESSSAQESSPELHMAVWLADNRRVKELLQAKANVNGVDNRGFTPLMLAVELLPRAQEYEDVIHQLLDSDADPRARSAIGWSPLDEAVAREDARLVRLLFECAQHNLKARWEERLRAVMNSLLVLPDFECQIRWEFDSPVLPLFNKLAPSDVLHLRKSGDSLRLDSTLASWKRFRFSKRREFTTLFQGNAGSSGGPRLWQLNHSKRTISDMTEGLDKEETGAVVDDLVAAEAVQWDMQMKNLEVAEATTWLGHLAPPCEVNGWQATRFDVRGSLGLVMRKKGSRRSCATFEDYFGRPLPADACLPEFRQEFAGNFLAPSVNSRETTRGSNWVDFADDADGRESLKQLENLYPIDFDDISTCSEVMEQWPESTATRFCESSLNSKTPSEQVWHAPRPSRRGEPSETSSQVSTGSGSMPSARKGSFFNRSSKKEVGDKIGKKSQRVSASVWLASNFAIPIEQFLPVLEALSIEHEAMRRVKELMHSQGLKDAAERVRIAAEKAAKASSSPVSAGNVFPVKVMVPLNLAVRAVVHFEAFELKQPGTLSPDLFEVPKGYTFLARKEAQKTLNRTRKRMLLAQLAL